MEPYSTELEMLVAHHLYHWVAFVLQGDWAFVKAIAHKRVVFARIAIALSLGSFCTSG
ncbi:MAG: hypothetical protein KME38_00840 [Spirirestis rafaelensis WJT71-NPBG6]|jgi:hypothetical protein|nr:hypothetical protein [Spirirestis rafaelensis WJT71-NPBG6]